MSADATPTGVNEIILSPDEQSQAPSSITESENSNNSGMMLRRSSDNKQTNTKPKPFTSSYKTPKPRKEEVVLRSSKNHRKAKVAKSAKTWLPQKNSQLCRYFRRDLRRAEKVPKRRVLHLFVM